ncbi:MAG: hypothetical protein VKJ64_21055 [Leptolyngbyaceae bacterium]|nr:hypothetical protein [Leptolyngbyaceae bacterium]
MKTGSVCVVVTALLLLLFVPFRFELQLILAYGSILKADLGWGGLGSIDFLRGIAVPVTKGEWVGAMPW